MLAPFVPTPAICINAAFKLLEISNSKIFYDFGGGDGRVSFAALRYSSGICKCIEYDDKLCKVIRKEFKKYCRMHKINENDQSRFELLQENILNVNFCDATHIYMYLSEEGMNDIEPLLNKYLKQNTRIVSCEYPITNWKHIQCERVWDLNMYLYQT